MAATFAEAKADFTAAKAALATATALLVMRLAQLETASATFDPLDPGDPGFDAAASAVKLRIGQYKNAKAAVVAQREALALAIAECKRLAP